MRTIISLTLCVIFTAVALLAFVNILDGGLTIAGWFTGAIAAVAATVSSHVYSKSRRDGYKTL